MEPDYSNMTNDELEALIKQRVANAEKDGFFRHAHQVAAWAGAGKSKRFEYGSNAIRCIRLRCWRCYAPNDGSRGTR
jgi:hypothetical protein